MCTRIDPPAGGGRGVAPLAILLLGLLSSTCAPRVPPPSQDAAAIRTDRDRYLLRPGQIGQEVTIIASFTAPTDTTVYIVNCNGAFSWGLQRLVEDRWTDAWTVATNLCLSPPIVVPGGETRTDTLTAVSYFQGMATDVIEPGTYRVVWNQVLTSFDPDARPFGQPLSLERRVSGPVTIERAS